MTKQLQKLRCLAAALCLAASLMAGATPNNGINNSASPTVTSSTVYANSISLNQSSLSLSVGNQATLTATVLPSNTTNKSVKWQTTNYNVASVSSSGVVTANSVGTATIVATTEDGTYLSATCSVIVKDYNFKVNDVAYNINYDNKTVEVAPSINPDIWFDPEYGYVFPSNTDNYKFKFRKFVTCKK